MMIDLNENYYIAKCDNKINSICKMSEGEYKDWNGKCTYGKDGGVYCTSNFKLTEKNEKEKKFYIKSRRVIDMTIDVENMDSIKDKIEELSRYAENQYGKGIDDYKNRIKEELDRFEVQNLDTCVLYDLMDRKAEQLKAGGKDNDD